MHGYVFFQNQLTTVFLPIDVDKENMFKIITLNRFSLPTSIGKVESRLTLCVCVCVLIHVTHKCLHCTQNIVTLCVCVCVLLHVLHKMFTLYTEHSDVVLTHTT